MSEVSANEIPFNPKLPPSHKDRLKAFARRVRRIGALPSDSGAWSRKLDELRTEACDHRHAVRLSELKLMVAKNLLLDLATQGWRVSVRGGKISLSPQFGGANGEVAKEVIRRRHLQERDAQLREPSVIAFVRGMERRRLTPKGWHSIFSVMRDGQELAQSLAKLRRDPCLFETSIGQIIKPYIQFVETGAHCT